MAPGVVVPFGPIKQPLLAFDIATRYELGLCEIASISSLLL